MTPQPVLAVIPARGGSKGLPGKNIRPLLGLPLIVHSIRCAAATDCIARCVVTTDSQQIADVARAHHGDVPFVRPAELAGDDTPMMPVLTHALAEVERMEGRPYGSVLLLDPTSPGRTPEDIETAVRLLAGDPRADGVVSCSRPTFNPFWVGCVQRGAYLEPAFEMGTRYNRRQDVPPFLRINGALYLWRREFIQRAPTPWTSGRHLPLEIPEGRAFSIDDEYEFRLAELMLQSGLVNFPWTK